LVAAEGIGIVIPQSVATVELCESSIGSVSNDSLVLGTDPDRSIPVASQRRNESAWLRERVPSDFLAERPAAADGDNSQE